MHIYTLTLRMIYSMNYILNHKSVTLLRYLRTCAFLSTQPFPHVSQGVKLKHYHVLYLPILQKYLIFIHTQILQHSLSGVF